MLESPRRFRRRLDAKRCARPTRYFIAPTTINNNDATSAVRGLHWRSGKGVVIENECVQDSDFAWLWDKVGPR
ncbi:hypothetical protein GW17_00042921 [Ensete ventricosum]|uniref:Uncharacterized protein n=1 Tax=Ensete ventricosum TaxID=4639 RepID=A0A444D8U6_ENSVE|nr:hypothetical protein B296_00022947 [Ensete ventricosum]RWV94529.1 hypothetical protein GW17_00042921 [Ensete ventricosum]